MFKHLQTWSLLAKTAWIIGMIFVSLACVGFIIGWVTETHIGILFWASMILLFLSIGFLSLTIILPKKPLQMK